ncbi:hypothetical protein ERJ75_001391700 [Trypanosoma vivax]|uniref:Uncharacterized protein n=1 Tax=Trypanosoma vivax (strain Y486) TaxID=1055687 RepID=F9WNI2_TRYVY|nr:hypothetical protein ERJ75_001391700 [Trypanosoma vivax]CCD19100.1 hypothetical protein TvY486_0018060 [Trypanosoma vivax Y486]|eukprot:CCD19100.1 hypothetical protein TvY486_0018060 [Trypanosoma vivax Y486]
MGASGLLCICAFVFLTQLAKETAAANGDGAAMTKKLAAEVCDAAGAFALVSDATRQACEAKRGKADQVSEAVSTLQAARLADTRDELCRSVDALAAHAAQGLGSCVYTLAALTTPATTQTSSAKGACLIEQDDQHAAIYFDDSKQHRFVKYTARSSAAVSEEAAVEDLDGCLRLDNQTGEASGPEPVAHMIAKRLELQGHFTLTAAVGKANEKLKVVKQYTHATTNTDAYFGVGGSGGGATHIKASKPCTLTTQASSTEGPQQGKDLASGAFFVLKTQSQVSVAWNITAAEDKADGMTETIALATQLARTLAALEDKECQHLSLAKQQQGTTCGSRATRDNIAATILALQPACAAAQTEENQDTGEQAQQRTATERGTAPRSEQTKRTQQGRTNTQAHTAKECEAKVKSYDANTRTCLDKVHSESGARTHCSTSVAACTAAATIAVLKTHRGA